MEQNAQEVLEQEILQHTLNTPKYFSAVVHHLQPEYFESAGAREVWKTIKNHYLEYHGIPTMRELVLSFRESPKAVKEAVTETLRNMKVPESVNFDMLMDQTEKFIKLSIFRDAVIAGADALGNSDHNKMIESFSTAEQAVSVNLTSDLGVSIDEIDKIYDDFQDKPGILTGISSWDKMFGSGVTTKTLSAFAAASGVGKSAAMVDFAVKYLTQGMDVVIVTLEMSEAEFYKRIYSNLFDIDIGTIKDIDKQVLKNKLNEVKDTIGNLVIKEFPTGGLTPLGLDGFLDQLKTERNIDSPVVFVDYLGIMGSDKVKQADNSYAFYGSIAEELRAVAQKRDIVMWTALQLNRSAVNNLEADQSSLSESMKILMILDFLVILSQTKEMKEKGEIKASIVKNRFSGKTWDFNLGFDYHHFRFVDKFNIEGDNITASDLTNAISGQMEGLNLGNMMAM